MNTDPNRPWTWERLKWAVRDALGRLVCLAKGGCEYKTACFHSNCLYFCARCGREMLGRTWDDIEPLTGEDRDQLDYIDLYGLGDAS